MISDCAQARKTPTMINTTVMIHRVEAIGAASFRVTLTLDMSWV